MAVARRILLAFATAGVVACQVGELAAPAGPATPFVISVTPSSAPAGGTVRVAGGAFATEPSANRVLLDGFPAVVLAASEEALEVRVPDCLPPGSYGLTVTVAGASTRELRVEVGLATSPPRTLAPGEDRLLEVSAGGECVALAGGSYLVAVHAAGTVAGARFDFSLRGASGDRASGAAAFGPSRAAPVASGGAAAAFRQLLHAREAEALAAGGVPGRVAPPGPSLPEERAFHVLDATGRFVAVRATLRLVSQHGLLYQDVEAASGGFTQEELEALAEGFDTLAVPTVTGVFGAVPDVDGNGRVILLFTPAVNRLSPPGASAYVGGFFFGGDLVPGAVGGNGGEVLYLMVPDAEGRFGDPRSSAQTRAALAPVLAHELQHLVHFGERMLARGAARQEALWLSEALAQSAETLVAERLERQGDPAAARVYREPAERRAREFLGDPGAVSLIIGAGQGSLAERGAGWLFLRYLVGHHGTRLLSDLTRTTRTGPENLEAVTGAGWVRLLSDWSAATALAAAAPARDISFAYRDLDLRSLFSAGGEGLPVPRPLPPDFHLQGTRLSASGESHLLEVAPGEHVALALTGRYGAPLPAEARFLLRVVRLE